VTYRNLPPLFRSEQRICCKCEVPLYDGVDDDLRDGDDDYCGDCAKPYIIDALDELFGALNWILPEAIFEPAGDVPRLVVRYDGVQIRDAREHVEVHFTKPPKRGVVGALRYVAGFRRHTSRSFWATSNPKAIFDAQGVLAEFGYREDMQR
jgi:hypothetical protein